MNGSQHPQNISSFIKHFVTNFITNAITNFRNLIKTFMRNRPKLLQIEASLIWQVGTDIINWDNSADIYLFKVNNVVLLILLLFLPLLTLNKQIIAGNFNKAVNNIGIMVLLLNCLSFYGNINLTLVNVCSAFGSILWIDNVPTFPVTSMLSI